MATTTEIKKLAKSEIEITGTTEYEDLEKFRAKAIKHLSEETDLPGFRKGSIPENVLISKLGEHAVLEEMAEVFLSEEYPRLILEQKIEALGRPFISVLKLAKGNPFEWRIRTAIYPELALPDYEKIAAEKRKKKEPITVSDEEIEKVLRDIYKERTSVSEDVKTEDALPPLLDDAFAQTIGDFKTLDELRSRIKSNLQKEKETRAAQKTRTDIIEAIVAETKGDIPDVVTESELGRMLAEFKGDVAQMGVKFEDYLIQTKKTLDEIRTEWRPGAEKRARAELVLQSIAKEKAIRPQESEIEKEVKHLLDHYHDADPGRTRIYIESVLTNNKVLEYLERE